MQHDFILLDRSGSMQSLWAEALSSVNAYVGKLAKEGVDTGVTLATFDTDGGKFCFDIVRDRVIPSTWKLVDAADASPRGMTPLNDAVGKIVSLAEGGGYDRVAIIVMTDGHENASKELSTAAAKAALDRCRVKNWQVIFLGADFDNAAQAQAYGNAAHATAESSPRNLGATMDMAGAARASYAATGTPMRFSAADKRKLKTR